MHRLVAPFLIVVALGTSCATAQIPAESPEHPAPVATVVPVASIAAPVGSVVPATKVEAEADKEDSEATGSVFADMSGDKIGTFGAGGIGLTGAGSSGGTSQGLGLGNLGGLGHGSGIGSSASYGRGSGTSGGRSHPPNVVGAPTAQGQLDSEIIRGVVMRNRSRVTFCYREELAKDPNLEGRLAVRFIIARDGNVASATANVEIPNTKVVSCVVRTILLMSFPPPAGGTVVVTFPFSFRRGAVSGAANAGDAGP